MITTCNNDEGHKAQHALTGGYANYKCKIMQRKVAFLTLFVMNLNLRLATYNPCQLEYHLKVRIINTALGVVLYNYLKQFCQNWSYCSVYIRSYKGHCYEQHLHWKSRKLLSNNSILGRCYLCSVFQPHHNLWLRIQL